MIYTCFSQNILNGIYTGESVLISMIQVASSLGIKEIYLMGVDNSYNVPNNQVDELYITSEGESNHFHEGYRNNGDIWVEPRVDKIELQFKAMEKLAKKYNITIYNATRGGKLEVFQRVNFDDLFRKKL